MDAKLPLAFALAVTLGTAVAGADESVVGRNPDHEGHALYQRLCSDCHGVRADGKGPLAAEHDPPPADLTRLRSADGGPLRHGEIEIVIDGRRTLRAHGEGEMPVWGWILVPDEPNYELREKARLRLVTSLADYILSIQQSPDAERGAE